MSVVSQGCSCASQGCFWLPAPWPPGIFLCSAILPVSPAAFLTVPTDCASDNETFFTVNQPIISYNLWFHFLFTILLCDIFNVVSLKVPSRQTVLQHAVGKMSCKCGGKSLFACGHVLVAAADAWCLLRLAGRCRFISPSRLLRAQG